MRNGVDQNERRGKSAPVIRCAIYTRESTEEGLEQHALDVNAVVDSALGGPCRCLLTSRSAPSTTT